MKVNGYILRQAIGRWELKRDTAAGRFESSLVKFPDEHKLHPDILAEIIASSDEAIAKLQLSLTLYNLAINVRLTNDTEMTLYEAVHRVSNAGRLGKKWRDAAGKKRERYGMSSDTTRQAGEIHAERVVTDEHAMGRANKAAAYASDLRAAIGAGNATLVTADSIKLDPSLLAE
jgi:hypothetical protein